MRYVFLPFTQLRGRIQLKMAAGCSVKLANSFDRILRFSDRDLNR